MIDNRLKGIRIVNPTITPLNGELEFRFYRDMTLIIDEDKRGYFLDAKLFDGKCTPFETFLTIFPGSDDIEWERLN